MARTRARREMTRARGLGRRRGRRALLAGAAAGGVSSYLLDPDQGRRRRALLQDKLRHSANEITSTADVVARDARNRVHGLKAEAQKLLDREQPSDGHIEHRVNEAIADLSRHPRAIEVTVTNGRVRLSGPILRDEVDAVMATVARLPGVDVVENDLEVHDQPGSVAALQGEGRRGTTPGPELLQQHWSPAPRALAGAIGGAMLSYGAGRGRLTGTAATAAGGLLLARAATNLPVRQLVGMAMGEEAVHIEKTIDIAAPVEKVWSFVDDYETFPTFMTHVRAVRAGEDGVSHWTVEGPLGVTVEWEAEITERRPNELLAWRTRPGATVEHAGQVALERANAGATRLHVELSYHPAGGAAAHAVARVLGADPKTQLDDDLLRMKTMIEEGKRPHDAAQPAKAG
jgi:uncharacterized membrane protein/gas vesicle protein